MGTEEKVTLAQDLEEKEKENAQVKEEKSTLAQELEKEKEKTEEERTKYQSIQQDMTTFQQERSHLLSQHNDAVRIKELKMKEEQKNDQNLKENLKKKFNNK